MSPPTASWSDRRPRSIPVWVPSRGIAEVTSVNSLTSTFFELLSDNLDVRPDKIALIDDDRSVTFSELAGEVDRLAAYLSGCGIVPGDRVIVHLRKSIREVTAMFAIAQIGAVVVNVNIQWTAEQLGYVAEDSGARLLIVEPQAARKIGTLAK